MRDRIKDNTARHPVDNNRDEYQVKEKTKAKIEKKPSNLCCYLVGLVISKLSLVLLLSNFYFII